MAIDVEGTDYVKLPVGTTAQRPVSPASGMMRFNTTLGKPEWYDAATAAWVTFEGTPTYAVSYLVVAGGGAGETGASNSFCGGGGGAGGYRSFTGHTLTKGVS